MCAIDCVPYNVFLFFFLLAFFFSYRAKQLSCADLTFYRLPTVRWSRFCYAFMSVYSNGLIYMRAISP